VSILSNLTYGAIGDRDVTRRHAGHRMPDSGSSDNVAFPLALPPSRVHHDPAQRRLPMTTWQKPEFTELSMNAEIGSYQEDFGGRNTPPMKTETQRDEKA
jgi:hypothetical protein